MSNDFSDKCKSIRRNTQLVIDEIDGLLAEIRKDKTHFKPESSEGEMYANLTLAKRHAEDVRQRSGLAIKAWDGGKSAYKD